MGCGKSFMRHLEQADEYFCYIRRKSMCKKGKNPLERDLLCKLEELLCNVRNNKRNDCKKKCDR